MWDNSNKNADVFTFSTAHGQLCGGHFSFCLHEHLNEALTNIAPSLSFQAAADTVGPDQMRGLDTSKAGVLKAAHGSARRGHCSRKML